MAKKGRHRKGGRVTPKGTRPRGAGRIPGASPFDQHASRPLHAVQAEPDEPDLTRNIRRALRTGEPFDLLAEVSSIVAVFDFHRDDPFARQEPDDDQPTLDDMVRFFSEVDQVETTALLALIGELASSDLLRARARRARAERRHVLPEWIAQMQRAEVYRTVEMVHVLGDGDNIMLATRLPTGHELTVVVYIDHNMGTLVKDAYVVPESLDELIAIMKSEAAADPDTEWRDLDAATARARIVDALASADITWPPFESDSWPACRPLVEWVLRRLPEGGAPYERPEWTEDDRQALAARILASPFGATIEDQDGPALLETILWFGTDYGPGDPLRWSPVAVEILLADWIPRKIVAPVDHLTKAPDVLRALVRYAHAERGIRKSLTDETLAAVDEWEPLYQDTIRSPRPQGPAALLAAVGAVDPDRAIDPDTFPFNSDSFDYLDDIDDLPYTEIMLDTLRRAVGDDSALRSLDTEPLPDEPFDWAGIPEDVHDRVDEVLALTDRCCNELLDQEYRTACRRLLSDVAVGDPANIRRKARSETAAAAICWIVGKANTLFAWWGSGLEVQDLNQHFGLKTSSSQRAQTMLKAIGVAPYQYGSIDLGTPRYLVSQRRVDIAELRDHYDAIDD